MSSILFLNPLAPSGAGQGYPTDLLAAGGAAPVKPVGESRASGDTSGFTGSGGGRGLSNQAANVAILRAGASDNWNRPADATGRSVINAQAEAQEAPFGVDLPEVEMPDPLPTSPFLKRNDS